MKSKIITSSILGLTIPWLYFLFVNIEPLRYINSNNEVTTIGSSGILGFIEFHGAAKSLIIYCQSFAICTAAVFMICLIYDLVGKNLK